MQTNILNKGKQSRFDQHRFQESLEQMFKDSGRIGQFSKSERENFMQNLLYRIEARPEIESMDLYDYIIRESNERTDEKTPQYSYLSASVLLKKLYKKVARTRGYAYGDEYKNFADFVIEMVEKGVYSPVLTEAYTYEELETAGRLLDPSKDRLFSYPGLFLLQKNYLSKLPDATMSDDFSFEDMESEEGFSRVADYLDKIQFAKKNASKDIVELPQERFLTVALYLMLLEDKEHRLAHVAEAYWALSNHYIGLATPTLTNSGRPQGTLSSCHILTMGDSLNSILDVIKDTGTFSQNGAGIGIYMGNLRANGSWIRKYIGSATGVVGPAKLFNEISQYVNQLNQRKGGIAVYLPLDHADIFDFLDLRLRTGSQERRAHSLFTAVTIPDEFMRRLKSKGDWTVFDPYEVKKKLGFDLHRMYDREKLKEGETPDKERHAYTYHYLLAESSDLLQLRRTVPIRQVYESIYRARKTGGTPYLYFSDTAARMNPNDHVGMPLGSNLCSEIIQNMSEDSFEEPELHQDGTVVIVKRGEGLVTCNLSSLVLHNVFTQGVDLQRVADIQYRMLDNVISLNRTPVPQSTHTNYLYRAVGAGQLGLATLLASEGIHWDSPEAATFVDSLFEKIAYANITASHKLAMEKGSYPLFEGSKWNTGAYFEERGYDSPEWLELKEKVSKGLRNAYLMATAPTGSNSLIQNGSASLDPLYDVVYLNKKEDMNATIVPSNYDFRTKGFYKSAFQMDEMWSINIIAKAQRHIDQGISHNMHLPRETKGSELFRLDYAAWDKGLKTIYYTYTRDVERKDDCVFCEG